MEITNNIHVVGTKFRNKIKLEHLIEVEWQIV